MRFVVTLVNSGNVAILLGNLMQLLSERERLLSADLGPVVNACRLESAGSTVSWKLRRVVLRSHLVTYGCTEPGGYLQWFDLNPLSSRAVTTRASSSTTAIDTLAAMMQNPGPDTDYS